MTLLGPLRLAFVYPIIAVCIASISANQQVNVITWGGDTNVPASVTNAVAISACDYSTAALNADGTVVHWGQDAFPTDHLSNIVAIGLGTAHGVALQADKQVRVWGNFWTGTSSVPMTVPTGLPQIAAVAAGHYHNLALTEAGTVISWGDMTNVPPTLTNVVAVSAGYAFNLALRGDGTVTAWGDNSKYQTNVPSDLENVVAIFATPFHGLALRGDGSVVGWGLGRTSVLPEASNVVAIAGGMRDAVAVRRDGSVLAWAEPSWETPVPSTVTQAVGIAAGFYHRGALLSGDKQPPFITSPMVRRAGAIGETVSFYASASGAWPLTYQWQFQGTNMPGATSQALVVTNIQPGDAGNYTFVVTNAFGAVTSAPARLVTYDVSDALGVPESALIGLSNWSPQMRITRDGTPALEARRLTNGSEASVEMAVDGPGKLTFWWKVSSQTNADVLRLSVNAFEQIQISGEQNWQQRTVYLGHGHHSLRWSYMKDNSGASNNDAAWLEDIGYVPGLTPVVIVAEPTNRSLQIGQSAAFSVQAVGTPPLSVQWFFNGSGIQGATNSTVTISNSQASNAGWYFAVVSNDFSSVTSAVVRLLVPNGYDLALNTTNWNWVTTGTGPWTAQSGVSHDGIAAVRLRVTNFFASSGLQTVVEGPGELSFWWRVDYPPTSRLLFSIDAASLSMVGTHATWYQNRVSVPAGIHTLTWTFSSSSPSSMYAAFIDEIIFQPQPALTTTRSSSDVSLLWPQRFTNFVLETATALSASNEWVLKTNRVLSNGSWIVIEPAGPSNAYYRLRKL